jgi:rhomboid family GlyGly-CTERM serine protease
MTAAIQILAPHATLPDRKGRLPLYAALLCVLALATFPAVPAELLQYDRSAIRAGEWWRVLTGHLTHWSLDHLAWDVATFAVLGFFCERRNRRRFLGCVLGSAALISAAVWFLRPDLTHYRGLSGIDSALFVFLATTLLRDAFGNKDHLTALATTAGLAALAAKTTWELTSGTAFFVDASSACFEPLPLAHLIGGGVGLLVALSRSPFTRSSTSHPKERAS